MASIWEGIEERWRKLEAGELPPLPDHVLPYPKRKPGEDPGAQVLVGYHWIKSPEDQAAAAEPSAPSSAPAPGPEPA